MKLRLFGLIPLFVAPIYLASCSTAETVKREPLAPPVSKKFELDGHLQQEPELAKSTGVDSQKALPDIVEVEPINVDPSQYNQRQKYSVSAINVPVDDLLFNLALDAKKEIEIASDVRGQVTLNAMNQPLDLILKRITEQVNASYELSGGLIIIRKDRPYWHTYRVDYVNVTKTTKDSTVMKLAVGSVGASSDSSGDDRASEFKKEVVSSHDFWKTLITNIKSIAAPEELLNASNATVLAPSAQQQTNGGTAGTTQQPIAVSTNSSEDDSIQTVVLNREAGLVSVFTTAQRHKQVEAYIEEVTDRTEKQVLIEATVVEVELKDEYQAGIDWSAANSSGNTSTTITQGLLGSNLSTDPNFSINLSSTGDWNFSLGIKMLQQFGDAKVLSSPKIMAMNNQSALLKVVNNEVYFTVDVQRESATASSSAFTTYETEVHTVPVGFMMNMTPFISNEDEIAINIRPTLTRIVEYVNDPNPELAKENIVSRIPVIQEREMDSVLRLRNRQTAVIGGLIQDQHSNEKSGVPGLMQIPWVGDFFTYRNDKVIKSELVIFLRPIIVKNPDIDHGDLKSMKRFLRTKAN